MTHFVFCNFFFNSCH